MADTKELLRETRGGETKRQEEERQKDIYLYDWFSVFLRDHGFPQVTEVMFHPELISGDVFIGPPPPQVVKLYEKEGLEGGTMRQVTWR